MKNLYSKIPLLAILATGPLHADAQCSTTSTLGSASNMFTLIRNGNHPVAVDNSLNTILFIHRNDAALYGGNSGQLRYDISTNGGTTWTNNVGPLNPGASTDLGRYPNAAIYNPTLNTTPTNAYISYFAPTTNGTTWTGIVSGVRQLNGSGGTENYNQQGVVTGNIQHSLVKGAPGVFWSIDPISSTSYIIYKGTWNSTTSDIVWASTHTLSPSFASGWSSTQPDYNIGFDPTGQIGWVSLGGHLASGPSGAAVYPLFYKTTDGGSTWTGPIQVDLTKFSCITTNVQSGAAPSANPSHDLTVDVNGNPHYFTTIGSANSYVFNYNAWHHMFDITLSNGVWVAYDVANVNGAPQNWGGGADLQIQAPQASRTADGSKVFFSWSDNANYSLGAANASPDLFARAFDVGTKSWTQVKNFTSCNSNSAGRVLYPHMAPEVLQPLTNTYKIVTVYGVPTNTTDMTQQSYFAYLDNTTFASSEFTVATPSATINIQQGASFLYCPNSTVNINVSGNPGQVLWNTGATTATLPVTSGTMSTYSVVAQAGCYSGTASISLINLSFSAGAITQAACPGAPVTFSASGNATNYTWTPGQLTGTNVTLNPSASPVTVSAGGTGCASTQTVAFNLLPAPLVTITGKDTICEGTVSTLTAAGASTYLWSDGGSAAVNTIAPSQNTVYTVIGTGANSCTNTASRSIVVKPSPTLTTVMSSSAVCSGGSMTLTALGAISYSWSNGSILNSTSVSPVSSTVYTVTGTGNNQCSRIATVAVTVHELPTVTASPSRSFVCNGEKVTLKGNGAVSYTWASPASTSSSVIVTASSGANNYTLTGKDQNECRSTIVYTLAVNACTGMDGIEQRASSVLVYPNPSQGGLHVRAAENMELLLVNQLGQHLRTLLLNEENDRTIHISDLEPGIYFIGGAVAGQQLKVVVQ